MSTSARQHIEEELHELWKPEEGEKATDIFWFQRSYTTNLVVYAPSLDFCGEVDAVLQELTPSHPGRYIILCPAAGPLSTPLRHQVSGHCQYDPVHNRRFCCDIINLEAGPTALEHLYGLTLSLLIADLPVEVWWPDEIPLQSLLFKNIAEESDRVWIDSARFRLPHQSLANLAKNWKLLFPDTLLADLNWIRFLRWRSLIAELFDGEWASYLQRIREINIEYGEGCQPTRSFLLVCWLASRLGWHYGGKPLASFPDRLEFAGSSGKVAVTIRPVPVKDPRRDRLYAVRLHTTNGHQGDFSVVRDQDPQCVLARSEIDGKEAFSRMLYFDHLESVRLLAEGLRHSGKDASWEESLAMLSTIIKA